MPIPSAAEMNPSDGAVAIFGKVALWSLLTVVLAAIVTVFMPFTTIEGWGDAGGLFVVGVLVGLAIALVVSPVSGFLAAALRHRARRSLPWALGTAAVIWAVWSVVLVVWLNMDLNIPYTWKAMADYLPGMLIGLAGSLLIAGRVHRSSDPR